jgi:esterase/lipase superfamily enzyme
MKRSQIWYSDRVQRHVRLTRWGHYGTPVLLFPTAGGDAEEAERMQLIDALRGLIDEGRVKVYSCDSVWSEALLSRRHSPQHCMWLKRRYHDYIYREVVPAIRADCHTDDIRIVTAGASIGGFNAVAALCLHPDAFCTAIGMSGTYDVTRLMDGLFTDDLYYTSPLHYLGGLDDGWQLQTLRQRMVLMATGEGQWENPAHAWNMARVLGAKDIPNRVDSWGPAWAHDWPTWRQMLPQYLAEFA